MGVPTRLHEERDIIVSHEAHGFTAEVHEAVEIERAPQAGGPK